MRCQYCGLNVDLPFRCPFCGKYFCADHRLPEFHACQGIKRDLRVYNQSLRVTEKVRKPFRKKIHPLMLFPKSFYRLLVSTEIIHMSLGALMVMLVGISTALSEISFWNMPIILLFALIFVSAYVPHELAHKFTAKHYGLWAEFRLTLIGVIITLISILSPIIKIVSPGAVVISGEATRENIGKISLSGPLTNIIFSVIFLVLSISSSARLFEIVFAQGALINALVSLFNLIPFSILDGAKIFWWNKYFWIITFLASLILVAANLMILY